MRLHHVGYVVRDVEAYAHTFPGLRFERAVDDPLQRAHLALYDAGGCYIELIRPADPESFTWAHLERHGEGLHHVCYEGVSTEDLDDLLAEKRMLKVRGPMFAPLFDRQVIFALTRRKALVEFLL